MTLLEGNLAVNARRGELGNHSKSNSPLPVRVWGLSGVTAVAAGGAAWDHSGMARVLEGLAHHEIGQEKASA